MKARVVACAKRSTHSFTASQFHSFTGGRGVGGVQRGTDRADVRPGTSLTLEKFWFASWVSSNSIVGLSAIIFGKD